MAGAGVGVDEEVEGDGVAGGAFHRAQARCGADKQYAVRSVS